MDCWNKFSILVWKNTKMLLRNRKMLFAEIYSVFFNVLMLVILRWSFDITDHKQMIYDSLRVNEVLPNTAFHRAYSPSDNIFLNKMMTSKYPEIIGQPNATELEKFLMEHKNDEFTTWIGIQFEDDFPDKLREFSGNITIKLRYGGNWHIQSRREHSVIDDPKYMDLYFCAMMYNLTYDIVDEMEKKAGLPKQMYLKRFPYPQYEQDEIIEHFGRGCNFGFLFMAFVGMQSSAMAKSITSEKDKKLKESMKVMGLPSWLHWAAWFLQFFVIHLIFAISMTLMLTLGNIVKYTDWTLVFILLVVYILGLTTFSFASSVFIAKASRSDVISQLVWLITVFPYLLIRSSNFSRIGASVKYISSLFTTSGMAYGLDIISLYETRRIGVQWNNIFETSAEFNMCFGKILLIMFIDVFIYLIIALYVEQIFPGEYGDPKKWYFFFTKQFWCGAKRVDGRRLGPSSDEEYLEEKPTRLLKAGIMIENLCKNFGPNEVVKDLTLKLYEDQITVLVGHNGAGKTMTMSMLTGLLPPTKGTAIINGYDIRTQIVGARESMGLCLQHNVLFKYLTVKEHLQFFCKLKGTKESAIQKEVDSLLKLLNLEDKADEISRKLSGGMKRKLSIGIAFCGNSKVIMLDEPTAGMDPAARRFIWKFLKSQKKGRTILLTTHFMDEADFLGDRIAIMSNGELKCCGSSFFLKKKYGTGYHLTIEQLPYCEPRNVTRVLEEYIPQVKIHTNTQTKVTYLLPEDHKFEFPSMLQKLEHNMDSLGIRNFGISLSDLEEVFMKVGTNKSSKNLQAIHNHRSDEYTNEIGNKFGHDYIRLLENYNQKYEITDNITTTMLRLMENKLLTAKYQYIVGASFDEGDGPIAWVNDQPYHSVPLSLQLLLNSYLEKTAIRMNFVNFPLPDEGFKEEIVQNSSFTSDANLLVLSLAVAFIGSFYIIFNIKERSSRSKHLQFVSGINVFIFWSISLLVDLVTSLIPIILIIVSILILKPKGLSTSSEISVIGVLCSCLSIAALPMMYIFSFLFDKPSTGYFTVVFIGFILGFPAITSVTILEKNDFLLLDELRCLLRLMPHYDFIEGIRQITQRTQCYDLFNDCGEGLSTDECQTQKCREVPQSFCCTPEYFSFDEDGILPQILRMLLIALILFSILVFIDLGKLTNLKYKIFRKKKHFQPQEDMDEDVRKEYDFVHSTSLNQLKSQNILVLKDLVKKYKKVTAVNGLNLTVKKFECFGLLGVNGAGKTSTFKMMTAEEIASFGDGWINSYSILDQNRTVHKSIGYCPQFDALLDNLTARETLVIFSLIRGVPKDECAYTAEKLARDFNFTQYLDKRVKEFSGGNRRKLSTSIALIGDAPVILLDEPTTGMDPASKRHLWNELIKIRQSGKSIILTSHSMEECEAVCTRLAIMVNGNFQCLGSMAHLKSRFTEGLSLTLKIRKKENNSTLGHVDTTAVERFITVKFPNAEIKEKHDELLNYYIKDPNIKWSKIFAIMEKAKKKFDIEDYSVGQASMEQVFSRFAKTPTLKEIEEEKEKSCFKFWKRKKTAIINKAKNFRTF
ncbi:hypothetical protein WA026_005851 [Henosepilachna vigintioctopunctata]|uniref:ABC transporter domain-containing protein n=1 Tax=Henosepilachna vigintioctopunctata TaxID=420089 RepID=A0AAW1U314_9CUCU